MLKPDVFTLGRFTGEMTRFQPFVGEDNKILWKGHPEYRSREAAQHAADEQARMMQVERDHNATQERDK